MWAIHIKPYPPALSQERESSHTKCKNALCSNCTSTPEASCPLPGELSRQAWISRQPIQKLSARTTKENHEQPAKTHWYRPCFLLAY